MGQTCSWMYCSCCRNCACCDFDSTVCGPRYARYRGDDNDVDLENIIGDLLELDPLQYDKESGMDKISHWIDAATVQVGMPPSFVAISRAKCIKYWQVLQTKPASKLSGSFVRFCFEKRPNGELPRLLIEHKGKSVIVRSPQERNVIKSNNPEVHVWVVAKCGNAKMLSKEYLMSSPSFLSVEYRILDDSLLRRYSQSQVSFTTITQKNFISRLHSNGHQPFK